MKQDNIMRKEFYLVAGLAAVAAGTVLIKENWKPAPDPMTQKLAGAECVLTSKNRAVVFKPGKNEQGAHRILMSAKPLELKTEGPSAGYSAGPVIENTKKDGVISWQPRNNLTLQVDFDREGAGTCTVKTIRGRLIGQTPYKGRLPKGIDPIFGPIPSFMK